MRTLLLILLLALVCWTIAAATSDTKKDAKHATTTAVKSQTFDGWVSDEKCGAKISAACTKMCHASGVRLVFVNNDKRVIAVANQDPLIPFQGQHVTIEGKLENGVMTVNNVTAAK